jgi:23S rRNA pseudouridine2604 synthase
MPETVRLAQRVAEVAGCSRADAELYIQNGWVSVDGKVVEAPNHPVGSEQVTLADDARLEPAEPATILLHKPAGYDTISGRRPAAALVTPATHWADDPSKVRMLQRHFLRLTPLVPLDAEASGLMVFSQDGRVWRRLTEDAAEIEHEYLVEVRGEVAPYALAKLARGLSYGGRVLPPCKVSWQNETRLRFALKGIAPDFVPWMLEQVGLRIVAAKRIRIGRLPMAGLPEGQWRFLGADERF